MMPELASCQDGFLCVLLAVGIFAVGFLAEYELGRIEGMY